jgi:quercetin dioxygenase-like cupin family protein
MNFHDLNEPRDWNTLAPAPHERSWRIAEVLGEGGLDERFRRVLASTDSVRSAAIRIPAGEEVVEHRHERSDEVFVIVGGSATFTIDGIAHEVAAGDVLFAKGGERHGFKVGPEPLHLVVVVAPNLDDAEPH